MRIPRTWLPLISKRIVDTLVGEQLIVDDVDHKVLAAEVERILLEELTVEDRINDEVREILKGHEQDIDRGRLDYRTLFDLTKKKVVKERGVVI